MEYIDIINIVYDAWLATIKLADHEMKKNLRKIELSSNKEDVIKNIIASLDYENSYAGCAYINSNYTIGNNFMEIRETLSNFYFYHHSITKDVIEERIPDFIKEDAESFFLLLHQEIELRKMMFFHPPKKHSQYSETLLEIFFGDISVINNFFSRIQGKKGKNVVNEILALRELRKMKQGNEITNKLLHGEISKITPIGAISTFNSAFDLGTESKTKARSKASKKKK